MHKIGKIAIFQGGPHISEGIWYFDLIFCPVYYLVVPNIWAEFEPNRWSEHYHLLPGAAWFSNGNALNKFAHLAETMQHIMGRGKGKLMGRSRDSHFSTFSNPAHKIVALGLRWWPMSWSSSSLSCREWTPCSSDKTMLGVTTAGPALLGQASLAADKVLRSNVSIFPMHKGVRERVTTKRRPLKFTCGHSSTLVMTSRAQTRCRCHDVIWRHPIIKFRLALTRSMGWASLRTSPIL